MVFGKGMKQIGLSVWYMYNLKEREEEKLK